MAKPKTISEYISQAPKEAQKKLREIRMILKKAAPKATEAVKWGAPIFEEKRILFAFNAIKGNISFMPTPRVLQAFKKDLAKYATGKATVKFPLDTPLPKSLITKLAKYRVKDVRDNDARWM
jgi:uncharacterized protein YdhG (YjbR/CyaY superfamily)